MWGIGVGGKSADLCGCGNEVGSVDGVGVFAWDARFPGAFGWGALTIRRVGTFLSSEGGGA